jgi:hypothetical protein
MNGAASVRALSVVLPMMVHPPHFLFHVSWSFLKRPSAIAREHAAFRFSDKLPPGRGGETPRCQLNESPNTAPATLQQGIAVRVPANISVLLRLIEAETAAGRTQTAVARSST